MLFFSSVGFLRQQIIFFTYNFNSLKLNYLVYTSCIGTLFSSRKKGSHLQMWWVELSCDADHLFLKLLF